MLGRDCCESRMIMLTTTMMMSFIHLASILFSVLFVNCSLILSVSCIEGAIHGFMIQGPTLIDRSEEGRSYIYAEEDATIRLFGRNLRSGGEISFTTKQGNLGTNCQDLRTTEIFYIIPGSDETGLVTVNLPLIQHPDKCYYFCFREKNVTDSDAAPSKGVTPPVKIFPNLQFIHQGQDPWLQIGTESKPTKYYILPVWMLILFITVLLIFSGMFSGLNLGLMSLDKIELDIMMNSGSPKEKQYAKTIKPVRKHGNFLLCTILLGNVLINNTMAILLEDLTGSGLVAVAGATAGIVVIGEIIPQALCSRYGLAIGAKTVWFTKFFMFITFPISYPISRILDCVLGEEIGCVYNRDRLRELIRLTEKELDMGKDELNIITGALEMSKKTAGDIMTRLEDAFMLEVSSVLDFQTMNLIMKNGYSRIPIYEKKTKNIVALLNVKDLAFVDPDDRLPLTTLLKFYSHPLIFVFSNTSLDVMLQDFRKGNSHLAVVRRAKNESDEGDASSEVLGLVTLEDVIEEIIQAEIIDESDTITDNRHKVPRNTSRRDFSVFNQPEKDVQPHLSPQLALATYQFLSTSVPAFRPELISETILQKMIKQKIVMTLRLENLSPSECIIYNAGKPCDYFVLILQGRVEVAFRKDSLVFESGPFSFFGSQALYDPLQKSTPLGSTSSIVSLNDLHKRHGSSSINSLYIPDFTVKAVTDLEYIRITRSHYIVAIHATSMERRPQTTTVAVGRTTAGNSADHFDVAWQLTTSSESNF